jgi:hypothetical protein
MPISMWSLIRTELRVGEPGPPDRPWLSVIRSEVARGMHTYRVHVVRSPLTPYLRFCFEWGYAQNVAAGEHISIIDLAEQDAPGGLLDHDFWLINDQDVVLMRYDEAGRFVGAEPLEDLGKVEAYRRCAAVAWDAGVPFADYWHAHPEAHRDQVPAQRRSTVDQSNQSVGGRASQTP